MTPLHVAVLQGNGEIIEILLEKGGANVDFPDEVLNIFIVHFEKFIFYLFILILGWSNSSFFCCSSRS